MTAFAHQEHSSKWGTIIWELRSLNHRYLEANIRLPDTMRSLESLVRGRISASLSRGKVECSLRLRATEVTMTAITLNHALVENLLKIAGEVEHRIGQGSSGLKLGEILRWPGVVDEVEPDLKEIKLVILDCLDIALEELIANREREGQRITELLQQRCSFIRDQVHIARNRCPEVNARWHEKLLSRLAEIPVDADAGRLEQELVIISHRLDVNEELDRLDTHLEEIQIVFDRAEPVGRRLDFLMQELNREANTLSSKSVDTDMTRAAIEIKVLIEQMREQIQNIE
jgi:uncharacterized protein (TIGR00255 family)